MNFIIYKIMLWILIYHKSPIAPQGWEKLRDIISLIGASTYHIKWDIMYYHQFH